MKLPYVITYALHKTNFSHRLSLEPLFSSSIWKLVFALFVNHLAIVLWFAFLPICKSWEHQILNLYWLYWNHRSIPFTCMNSIKLFKDNFGPKALETELYPCDDDQWQQFIYPYSFTNSNVNMEITLSYVSRMFVHLILLFQTVYCRWGTD